jgi:SAM-dependent methyltransferase
MSILDNLVCPVCHARFEHTQTAMTCVKCRQSFSLNGTFPDLLIGERFEDDICECLWSNEEDTGRFLSNSYLAPLFGRLQQKTGQSQPKVLSIGCGVGTDVEELCNHGFDAYGIDSGNRARFWERRKQPERYAVANAKYLPFEDESFDFIVMGCVLPHIGVGNDTYITEPDYTEQRAKTASEMVRVTKKGGYLVVSSPNKTCPVDFFHRRSVSNHMPRLHWPWENFLLSLSDYKNLFLKDHGCERIDVLPLKGYWGFFSSSKYLLGKILQIPVRFYFNKILSWAALSFIRKTALNPWLILLIKK